MDDIFPASKQRPKLDLHRAFTTLQNHCAGFLQNLPQFNPNPSSLQTHLHASFCSTKQLIDATLSRFNPHNIPSSSTNSPLWARIPLDPKTHLGTTARRAGGAMSNEAIEERLAGVPVYALSNPNEEFVLISGASSGKSVGLICFKKEDAEALLEQMKSMDPAMRKAGSKVVAIALNKVFQLKVNGVAFRLIPDSSQIRNALREREKAGSNDDGFTGVPVFQVAFDAGYNELAESIQKLGSRSLVLRSQKKSYRPVFFRKEDLENSLQRASYQQKKLNPAFRQGDIQVAVFEEIIKGMKESSTSTWDDVVFIPPGFDVSTDSSML